MKIINKERFVNIKGLKFDPKPIEGLFSYADALAYAQANYRRLPTLNEFKALISCEIEYHEDHCFISETKEGLLNPNLRVEIITTGWKDIGQKDIFNSDYGYYWMEEGFNNKNTMYYEPMFSPHRESVFHAEALSLGEYEQGVLLIGL